MIKHVREKKPHPFETLSAEELASAEAGIRTTDAGEETWQPSMPAPSEPPPASKIRHHRYGAAVQCWVYRNEHGAPMFATVRFEQVNPDGTINKVILPYTFGFRAWQVQSGPNAGKWNRRDGWHYKLPNRPLPLYGLDRLAARPEAPVLVCEGEKAADAAAALFPSHVCMTSQGGSGAPRKADWSPLARRDVTIWPDNDAAGAQYADAVVPLVEKAGARSVRTVNVTSAWPEGWDLADLPPDGVDSTMLVEMLAAAALRSVHRDDVAYVEIAATEVGRLSSLSQLEYAQQRLGAAKTLAIGVTKLDELCVRRRKESTAEKVADGGAEAAGGEDVLLDAKGRKGLFVNDGDLPATAADLALELAKRPLLFDRGGPCRLERNTSDDRLYPKPLTPSGVVNECHDVCWPWRWHKNSDGTKMRAPVTLSDRAAKLYLDRSDRWGLRPLDGVAFSPLLHADGSIRVAEGYDEETRLWCERVPVIEVPEAPTEDDARAALRRVRIKFRTFAFADAFRITVPDASVSVVNIDQPSGADESAFLIALLTAVCRASLQLAPAVMVRAPQISGAGTGKGLLVRAMCSVAFGIHPRAMTVGTKLEEMEKRIAAALIGAEPVLFLDNVNGVALKSDTLASAITERPASVRPLGTSTIMQLNSTALIAVTGNGVTLSEDMVRRFIVVELGGRKRIGLLLRYPRALPPGLSITPMAPRQWAFSAPGVDPIRISTDPAFVEEHPDNVELWSPGNPLFPMLEVIAEPSEPLGARLDGILRGGDSYGGGHG